MQVSWLRIVFTPRFYSLFNRIHSILISVYKRFRVDNNGLHVTNLKSVSSSNLVVWLVKSLFSISFFLEQRLVTLAPNIDFLSLATDSNLFLAHSYIVYCPYSKRNWPPLCVSQWFFFRFYGFFLLKKGKRIKRTFLPCSALKPRPDSGFGDTQASATTPITFSNYPNGFCDWKQNFNPRSENRKTIFHRNFSWSNFF